MSTAVHETNDLRGCGCRKTWSHCFEARGWRDGVRSGPRSGLVGALAAWLGAGWCSGAMARSVTRMVNGVRGWCSGGVAVLVDEAAEDLVAPHVSVVGDSTNGPRGAVVGRCRGDLLERSVWSMVVVVRDVLVDDPSEMT